MTKLVHDVGINDADYTVQPTIDGKRVWCPYYIKWMNMLTRCYSAKEHARQPSYIDCYVCDEWLSFMAFREWMMMQDWEGKQLDKDLIGDGRVYSPNTCCFIPSELNTLLQSDVKTNTSGYAGVSWKKQKNKWVSQIRVNGKTKYLGYFTDPKDGHIAYCIAKADLIEQHLATETNEAILLGLCRLITQYRSNM